MVFSRALFSRLICGDVQASTDTLMSLRRALQSHMSEDELSYTQDMGTRFDTPQSDVHYQMLATAMPDAIVLTTESGWVPPGVFASVPEPETPQPELQELQETVLRMDLQERILEEDDFWAVDPTYEPESPNYGPVSPGFHDLAAPSSPGTFTFDNTAAIVQQQQDDDVQEISPQEFAQPAVQSVLSVIEHARVTALAFQASMAAAGPANPSQEEEVTAVRPTHGSTEHFGEFGCADHVKGMRYRGMFMLEAVKADDPERVPFSWVNTSCHYLGTNFLFAHNIKCLGCCGTLVERNAFNKQAKGRCPGCGQRITAKRTLELGTNFKRALLDLM